MCVFGDLRLNEFLISKLANMQQLIALMLLKMIFSNDEYRRTQKARAQARVYT